MSTPPRSAIAESMARLSVQAGRILDSLAKQLAQARLASYQVSSLTARRNASRYLADVAHVERRKAVAHVHREAHRVRQELGLPTHGFVPSYLDVKVGWSAPSTSTVYNVPNLEPEQPECYECGMIKGAHPA